MVEESKIRGGSFKTMNLDRQLLRNIPHSNPTPIQRLTIPLIFEGRSIMGIARTGSGKTLCYLIPAIQRAIEGATVLILVPTKELVTQVKRVEKSLSYRISYTGKIIISTLRDIEKENINLLVVDEIDRILEEKCLKEHFDKIIENVSCQKLFFSATLPDNNPFDLKIVQVENKIPETIKHSFYFIPSEFKESALLNILEPTKKTIIFVATKYGVDFLLAVLEKFKFKAKGIYSATDDEARSRNFDDFISNRIRILVVTDVAARGLDIPHLDVSVSYDLCDDKTFVHRVGRIRGMGEQHSFVTYTDVFHYFNIKETHLPDAEIGTIPQNVLDKYNMSDLMHLKFSAMRGHQRCLDFRRKVSVPSEFKALIDNFDVHPRFKGKESLADQLKVLNRPAPVEKVEVEEEKKDFKDRFYIPYSKKEMRTHSSAFAVFKDDYVRQAKPKEFKRSKTLKKENQK